MDGTALQNLSSFIYPNNDASLNHDLSDVKGYVPRKFIPKFIKIGNFVTGVITALLITIVVVVTKSSLSADRTELHVDKIRNTSTDYAGLVAVSSGTNLWFINPDKNYTTFEKHNVSANVDIFDYDYRNKQVVWVDKNSKEFKSLHQNQPIESFPRKLKPDLLRIDFVAGNFYIIDNAAATVSVMNPKSGFIGVLTSEVKNPWDLVLDPLEGVMFIASKYHSISKVDMDGKNLKAIVNDTSVSSLAIDCVLKNVYFAIDFTSIEKMNYMGNSRVRITQISAAITSLSVSHENLYWTEESMLWSCAIEKDAFGHYCKTGRPQHLPMKNAKTVRSYERLQPVGDNPCERNQCQQLCLLTTAKSQSSRYSCACAIGWQLNRDGKSCKLVVDYLLYALGNHMRARILDPLQRSFTDVILPTEFDIEPLKMKLTVDFDYDMRTDQLFLSDDRHIYLMKIKSQSVEKKTLLQVDETFIIRDVAHDWISGNLYYTRMSITRYNEHRIIAVRYGEKYLLQKIVKTLDFDEVDGVNCPNGLIIQPDIGMLFYTARSRGMKDVQMYSILDERTVYLQNLDHVNMRRELAIDYKEVLLYYIEQRMSEQMKIKYIHFDNRDEGSFTTQIPQIVSIYVHQQWLYISNGAGVWRTDKLDGSKTVQMIETSDLRLSSVRIISPDIQVVDNHNQCALHNGGCKQFCFANSTTRQCKCVVETPIFIEYC